MKSQIHTRGLLLGYASCALLSLIAQAAPAQTKPVPRNDALELLAACRDPHHRPSRAECLLLYPHVVQDANEQMVPLLAAASEACDGSAITDLLAAGASAGIPDQHGRTALELAMPWGDELVVDQIAEHSGIDDLPSFAKLRRIDLALQSLATIRRSGREWRQDFGRFRLLAPSPERDEWSVLIQAMESAQGSSAERIANVSPPPTASFSRTAPGRTMRA